MLRWIMHVDMDAFYASVEQMDNAELRGKPVIVGGDSMRSVVATCSYEARAFGVHSAMPITQAKRLCPNGIYLPVRMWRYKEVSDEIMELFHGISPVVEQLSIDEAFLDMTGMEGIYSDIRNAGRLVKQKIYDRTGLHASVGLAPNKFLAKMASDWDKPDGLKIIEHDEAAKIIAPLPVTKIFGIGKTAAHKLAQFGIVTIGQLAEVNQSILQKVFGKNTYTVQQLALGIDNRPVEPFREAKSIGRESTFERDIYTYEECLAELLKLSEQVGYRLRRHGLAGRTLTLKLKFADFGLKTLSHTGEMDIEVDEVIYSIAGSLLKKAILNKGIRLIGISISNLSSKELFDLDFEENMRHKKRNAAIDELKERFGEAVIHRGK